MPGLRAGGPSAVHDLHPGTGPPGGHRIRVPGLRPADGRVRRAALLSRPGRPGSGAHGSYELAGLMDQLEEIWPLDGRPGGSTG